MTEYLIFVSFFVFGIGIGVLIMLAYLWFVITRPESKRQEPFPLNPELIEFWKQSVLQKEVELQILKGIREALNKCVFSK
mgnify:CR=1 FL=1